MSAGFCRRTAEDGNDGNEGNEGVEGDGPLAVNRLLAATVPLGARLSSVREEQRPLLRKPARRVTSWIKAASPLDTGTSARRDE